MDTYRHFADAVVAAWNNNIALARDAHDAGIRDGLPCRRTRCGFCPPAPKSR